MALFSIFIVWHAVAIILIGPFSKSYMRDGLMKLYGPYLELTELNRAWPFYAPEPFLGSVLSYETVSNHREVTRYPLTKARAKFEHAYFRYTNFYAYLFSDPDYSREKDFDSSVARYLCARHMNEDINQIRFILQSQKKFTYRDYRSGKRPLDPEFLTESTYGPYPCQS